MVVEVENDQRFQFVRQLSEDLASGEISLPSFPAVLVKIRKLLEDKECDFGLISRAVSADVVLVSRLFVFANSVYHNRSEEKIESLEAAVARLGTELVRNTALSLAVKQLLLAEKHQSIVGHLRGIWAQSMRFASASFAIAQYSEDVNEESAFMCGLLHEIGKLYILTKAKNFPDFLGDDNSIEEVLHSWHSQVGRCIVESWGFSQEIVESMDPVEFLEERTHIAPTLVDVVYAAKCLLGTDEEFWPEQTFNPSFKKLGLDEAVLKQVAVSYREKLNAVQQSLA